MAGGIFSLANLFGMTIRESANDGSDFTNPDADYRRLFLGEDGLLHVKDSAGTVTSPYTGGGSVATDTIWNVAGDIVQGTGSDTAARLGIGSAYQGVHVNAGATAVEYSYDKPACYESFLTAADVSMTSAGTWYSHANLSLTPPAGDYLVIGCLAMTSASASFTPLNAKIATGGSLSSGVLSGDTAVKDGLIYNPASNAGGQVDLTISTRVTLNGSTPVWLAGYDFRASDGTIIRTNINGGTTNKASSLVALRITSL